MLRSLVGLSLISGLFLSMNLGITQSIAAVSVTPVGLYAFESDAAISELSGITWASDDPSAMLYYAVSDSRPDLTPLLIEIDRSSGAVLAVSLSPNLPLQNTDSDQEGVAYDANTQTILIASENRPAVRQYDLGGNFLAGVDPDSAPSLQIFNQVKPNLAWESLAMQPGGDTLWTANEEPLQGDSGPTIRLQRFDGSLNPTGQWAYDLSPKVLRNTWTGPGVCDLLVLPDGTLLALERSLGSAGFLPGYLIVLYEVDLAGATDLAGGPVDGAIRVGKRLLWAKFLSFFNTENLDFLIADFEGMTLGPQLDNGDYSLLLLADNNASSLNINRHLLYALRLSLSAPAQSPVMGADFGAQNWEDAGALEHNVEWQLEKLLREDPAKAFGVID